MNDIVLLSLFGGIDGFALGFQKAGYTFKKHYYSEIDKHASANCKYNFPNSIHLGSVTNVRRIGIERPNIITFGSPCQDFSLAGKRAGMDGNRSSLITEAIRVVSECRPDAFIWENVKGAFSSNDSADFWGIIQAFANIGGYRLEWQLLNTSWFLPQNRERIYLVGHLAGSSQPGIFPIGESNKWITERLSNSSIVRTLSAGGHSGGHHSGMTLIKSNTKKGFEELHEGDSVNFSVPNSKTRRGRVGVGVAQTLDTQCNIGVVQLNPSKESGGKQPYQQNRIFAKEGISPTIDQSAGRWQTNIGPVLIAHVLRTDEAKEVRKISMKNGKDYTPFQGKKVEFKESDIMNTVTCATQKDNLIKTRAIRRLTEIECERLQGFPDDWTKFGTYEGITKQIPKTQRYKMCGNAVTVDVVEAIATQITITPNPAFPHVQTEAINIPI